MYSFSTNAGLEKITKIGKIAPIPNKSIIETQKIINNLLTRSYYNSYSELDENTVNFVILKILNILHSIDDKNLLIPFFEKLNFLSENDPNLEIRNFAKKSLKTIQ